MSWRVVLDRRAERELGRLPNVLLKRIVAKLKGLATEPFPSGTKKLQGHSGYRLRVGDYRVLYEVIANERRIVVYAVGHRRDVYRKH